MKAIVLATAKGRDEWLKGCLASFNGYTEYPILVASEYDYELGKIRWVYEHTNFDEFLLLQDSIILKNTDWIKEVMERKGSVSLSGHSPFFMYMGKYTREGLRRAKIPKITTKYESVTNEFDWTWHYANKNGWSYMWKDFTDTNVFTTLKGRKNMVLENDHLIKYKGTWSLEMLDK